MVWLMGATEMADTESGDRAALLLISTFFQPAPDAESGDKIREQSSLAPDSGILYRKNHRQQKDQLSFCQAQNLALLTLCKTFPYAQINFAPG